MTCFQAFLVSPFKSGMEHNKSGTVSADSFSPSDDGGKHELHLVQRGGNVVESDIDETSIQGFDTDRMAARTLLTADEEKKLLRRIDWHIMPLCSFMFMLKNMDADNTSNARIMNDGTDRNIMTQLNMSSNQYLLLPVLYYVGLARSSSLHVCLTTQAGTVHRF